MNIVRAFIYDETVDFEELFRKKEIFDIRLTDGKMYSVRPLEKHLDGSFSFEVLNDANAATGTE